jgi:hypothetical protein
MNDLARLNSSAAGNIINTNKSTRNFKLGASPNEICSAFSPKISPLEQPVLTSRKKCESGKKSIHSSKFSLSKINLKINDPALKKVATYKPPLKFEQV